MVVKWVSLEVHNGLVYRRLDSPKPSTPTMLQLLVPRCCVPEVMLPTTLDLPTLDLPALDLPLVLPTTVDLLTLQ